ncbi:hypothetical protein K1W69_20345 [Hoeflea sp. WL0058]|uniref:Uncharacterized protein n=1 Tax=Flavimaribacter sediminis TaxID=2865987 RepID=A0AAE2ZP84_9HYPH|nr:hypothetical protein [Flavimaribacter sediminis]MBW8639554.1 hypothetical protein [Flavimaribacter sediminis]
MVQRIAAFLIFVCVFSLPASAQDTSARAAADEYLTVAGMETVFPLLKSDFMDRLLKLEPFQRPEAVETLERIAETSFDPEIIRSKILDRVEANLTAEEMQTEEEFISQLTKDSNEDAARQGLEFRFKDSDIVEFIERARKYGPNRWKAYKTTYIKLKLDRGTIDKEDYLHAVDLGIVNAASEQFEPDVIIEEKAGKENKLRFNMFKNLGFLDSCSKKEKADVKLILFKIYFLAAQKELNDQIGNFTK